MTGSRKQNKSYRPSQTTPTYLRTSKILAARDEARRKVNEMHRKEGVAADVSSGKRKTSHPSPDLPFASKQGGAESEEEFDDGFMIVSLPGGVEAPLADTKKAAEKSPAEEVKPATDAADTSETKITGGFWPWSRGTSK
ncbi:hypothetical protein PRZ48_004518 [Zasmidium cellare]|uniref:Uncharacterized protein n=1 Tax=Zasmidium cellare TaxID=395010 RepID=A0ABR0ERX7_ZASCE|nr:hypothetical protein PRZ48_004518 [Zasmidium cellare]